MIWRLSQWPFLSKVVTSVLQIQKAVTAYWASGQLLPFGFARQIYSLSITLLEPSKHTHLYNI